MNCLEFGQAKFKVAPTADFRNISPVSQFDVFIWRTLLSM
jgi:hypothetical protein